MGKRNFVLKGVLISASVLAGLTIATNQAEITAHASPEATSTGVNDTGETDAASEPSNDDSSATSDQPTPATGGGVSDATKTAGNTSSSNASSTASKSSQSKLTVIKNNDPSVKIDNKLKISTAKTATLKSVKADDQSNATYDDSTKTVTITDPVASNTVTAKYGTVGTYNGQAVSAEITVSNIVKHTEDHIAPSNLASNVVQIMFDPSFGGGVSTYNIAQDELTIKFFNALGQQLNIDGTGYLTVGSLNGPSVNTAGNEYVNYDNSKNATYVTENSVVKYETNPVTENGNTYVGTSSNFTDELGAPTSEDGAVTFQLNGNAFSFLNGTTRYSLKSKTHHWSYALTTFSSATIAPATLPAPVLTVDKTSAKAGETVTYTLKQAVNTLGEDTMLRYQSWTETVTLPSEVTFQSGSLLDETGKVVSDAALSYDKTKGIVTVSLPTSYLTNGMALNGETYTVKLITKVNNGVANGEVGTAEGAVTVDKVSQNSNDTMTMYEAPIPVTDIKITLNYLNQHKQKIHESVFLVGKSNEFYDLNNQIISISGYHYVDSSESLTGYYQNNQTIDIQYQGDSRHIQVSEYLLTNHYYSKRDLQNRYEIVGNVGDEVSANATDYSDAFWYLLKGENRNKKIVVAPKSNRIDFLYSITQTAEFEKKNSVIEIDTARQGLVTSIWQVFRDGTMIEFDRDINTGKAEFYVINAEGNVASRSNFSGKYVVLYVNQDKVSVVQKGSTVIFTRNGKLKEVFFVNLDTGRLSHWLMSDTVRGIDNHFQTSEHTYLNPLIINEKTSHADVNDFNRVLLKSKILPQTNENSGYWTKYIGVVILLYLIALLGLKGINDEEV